MHPPSLGLFLIILAAMLWGTTGLSSRFLARVATVDPLSLGFWRLLLAVPAMLLIAQWQAPGSALPMIRRSWRALLLFGLGVAAYNVCFFAALTTTSVTATTLLALCSAPLFVALLARVFLREPLTPPVLMALTIGLVGTALLVVGQAQAGEALFQLDQVGGYLLALGAGLSYAGYSLVGRAKAQEYAPTMVVALAFVGATAMLAPLALAEGLTRPTTLAGWGILTYLSLGATATAYLLYIMGLRSVPATVASVVTLVEPLTAALLAALILGEALGPLSLLGAALLLGSLGLLTRAPAPRPTGQPSV